ncbi:hypothetical protein C8R43DRAFT_950855 [Mycena crocata]|nr:hypothetical protein C8R43DRAFT_950855 [Mycena crocata]
MSMSRICELETAQGCEKSTVQGLLFPTGDLGPRFVRVTQSEHRPAFDRPHVVPWLFEGLPPHLSSYISCDALVPDATGSTTSTEYHVFFPEQRAVLDLHHVWLHPINQYLNVRAERFILPSWHGNLLALRWDTAKEQYIDILRDELYEAAASVHLFVKNRRENCVLNVRFLVLDPRRLTEGIGTLNVMCCSFIRSFKCWEVEYSGRFLYYVPDWLQKFARYQYARLYPDGSHLSRMFARVPVIRGLLRAFSVEQMEAELWLNATRGGGEASVNYDRNSLTVTRFPVNARDPLEFAYTIVVVDQRDTGHNVHPFNHKISKLTGSPWRGNVLVFKHGKSSKHPIISMQREDVALVDLIVKWYA